LANEAEVHEAAEALDAEHAEAAKAKAALDKALAEAETAGAQLKRHLDEAKAAAAVVEQWKRRVGPDRRVAHVTLESAKVGDVPMNPLFGRLGRTAAAGTAAATRTPYHAVYPER
jgi:chromosome segregation ATPase